MGWGTFLFKGCVMIILAIVLGLLVTEVAFSPPGRPGAGTQEATDPPVRASGEAPPGSTDPSANCVGTPVVADDDIGGALRLGSEGQTFCIQPGVHRVDSALEPKSGQRLVGVYGAILRGAKVIGPFQPDDRDFVAPAQLPLQPGQHGDCDVPGCTYSQDVYLEGQPLRRAHSRQALGPGGFFPDYAANLVYLRDDPTGLLVEQAFAPTIIASASDQVEVTNLVIEMAASEAQTAALHATGSDWVITNNEVRFNHGVGISCSSCVARENYVHHNGQLGWAGAEGSGQLIEHNEIAYNNTAGYTPGWEAGGSKWVKTKGLRVQENYVHDNNGPGLWTDISNVDSRIARNYVSRNAYSGIIHEISFAAQILENIVVDNGWSPHPDNTDGYGAAGIQVAASPDVRVQGNVLIGNRNGIVAVQQARGSPEGGRAGRYEVENLDVRDNDVSMTAGLTGLIQDIDDPTYFRTRRNRFRANHYHLDRPDGPRFAWDDAPQPADAWRSAGNDRQGTFDTSVPEAPPPPSRSVGPRA